MVEAAKEKQARERGMTESRTSTAETIYKAGRGIKRRASQMVPASLTPALAQMAAKRLASSCQGESAERSTSAFASAFIISRKEMSSPPFSKQTTWELLRSMWSSSPHSHPRQSPSTSSAARCSGANRERGRGAGCAGHGRRAR